MDKKLISLIIILVFSFVSLPAQALFGTRPAGMGGAFTAIADDANAAYWNPAGFAINPGVDLTGSLLLNNRNEKIGDNMAALKMCFEAELNPFIWALGVGAVSLFALEGAKYLSDKGVLKKNWGRSTEKVEKEEAITEKVLQAGEEKTTAVGQKVKEKIGEVVSGAASNVSSAFQPTQLVVRPVFWGPWNYPWYHHNYYRPTYWENREETPEYSPQGKAQFAAGLTWVTDKNAAKGQNTNWYSLSLATGYEERVALGGNINIYDIGIITPGGSTIKGYGAGIDAGVLIRPIDELAFGIAAKELLTTDIHFENNATLTYQMTVNTGVAITPVKVLTLAADIHNFLQQNSNPQTFHYGAEFRPLPGLALRGGLDNGNKTAGASIMIGSAVIDYAYLGGAYNRTQTAGLTWKF
ncbi:MAG: hypothetical protein WC624_04775 [Candidatus Margulisiibacteriota bacterium]